MRDQDNSEELHSDVALSVPAAGAPYEVSLTKAFDKLTSQILIFLLAYVILVIGLSIFGKNLTNSFKTLLYIIPVLGVAAYLWENQKAIRREADENGIDVSAWIVKGAEVVAVEGAKRGDSIPEKVVVKPKLVFDNAKVKGLVFGSDKPADASEKYLMEQYMKLDEENKGELIDYARKLIRKQQGA
jgi:hypothetical protein